MPQPTREVKAAIQLLHQAMAIEPEPADKATIAQCLTALTRLQAKNMAESQGPGGQGGGGTSSAGGPQPYAGGGPPPGMAAQMQGGPNPLAALLAMRAGGG